MFLTFLGIQVNTNIPWAFRNDRWDLEKYDDVWAKPSSYF